MSRIINEVYGSMGSTSRKQTSKDAFLDMHGMQELLTETNSTLRTFGFNMEEPDAMKTLFRDNNAAGQYIDSLSEGLEGEDAKNFRVMANNTMDMILGRNNFANKSILSLLTEDNTSAGFMPVAKLIFPSATCF